MKTKFNLLWTLPLIFPVFIQSCEKDELIEEPILPQTSTATLNIYVDERIELLSIVQHFTSWAKKRHTKFDLQYKKDIDEWFASFSNHKAIQLCQEMVDKGFTYDVPPAFILCHSSLPDLKQNHAYTSRVLSRGGSQYQLEMFAEALRDFAAESNFQDFYNSQRDYYTEIENNIMNNMEEIDYVKLIENYCGEYKSAYSMIAAPLFQAGGYATTIESPEGDQVFSIRGPMSSKDGFPIYGDTKWFEYVTLHEFSHAFVNPASESNAYRLNQYADLYSPIKEQMSRMAYTNWISCVNEHLVRVIVARFAASLNGENACEKILKEEYDKGFRYIYELEKAMKTYEANRDRYKNFKDFYPEIIKCFKELKNN